MKAALLYGVGNVRIEEVPEPEPNDANVIIKIHKASICNGSDSSVFTGKRDFRKIYTRRYGWQLPMVFGHECSGEVVHVGKAVEGISIGDRIAFWTKWGAFAEYIDIYPAKTAIVKLSDNISFSEGSVMELLGSTMPLASQVELGQVVVIFGLGPAGLLLAQEAKLSGALEVIGIDCHRNRLEKAKELGVDRVMDFSQKDPVETIGRESCDVIIDATGENILDTALEVIRPKGKFLIYGVSDLPVSYNAELASYKGIDFLGCNLMGKSLPEIKDLMQRGEKLISHGLLKIAPLITHHLSLEKVVEGIEMCYRNPTQCIKIVIDIIS